MKTKNLLSSYITEGLKKYSKRKQKLYERFLKKRNLKNKIACKSFKNIFEKLKNNSKKD